MFNHAGHSFYDIWGTLAFVVLELKIIDNFIKKLLKSYSQLIRLKKKKKLFIQKHYLQFLSI